ncbi:autotransporter outer membrane beta-barrel domain-containing protein [Variovorax sp. J22P271]|uniref:autotransporter family protein n=1 Tax=Variovorax davisae TaxID=3053515 RepID=UPI002574A2A5|nr:autotransporter outer membrane beta-barrel domain-containing protein [Variovorax sp. J22P271]MDM0032243.1 autotransporter outer membrane beta-barrel domain-containing protein [Variovorax sp. J22P271]
MKLAECSTEAMGIQEKEKSMIEVRHLVRVATLSALGLGFYFRSVQAQPCAIVSGHITLASGACAVAPATALSASNTSAAVSATNLGTVIDLTPGATVSTATTRHGVDMINGGKVLLGSNTPVSVNASTTGLLGISINNSVISGSLGTGIPVILNNVTAGTNVSGYGLRAIQNSSVTLGLDLTSNFSKSAYGVRADTGSTVNLINASRLVLSGPDAAPGGAALIAVDPGSVIDARDGTIISNTGHDVTGIYMSDGGLVRVGPSTAPLSISNVAPVNGGSAGVVIDNTVVPAGTIDGVAINFSGIAGTGITATRGAQVTVSGARVQGAGMGVVADTLSKVTITGSSISVSDSNGGIVRIIENSGASFQTTFLRQGAGLFALGGTLDANDLSIAVPANGAYGVHTSTSVYSPATAGTLTFTNGTISTSGLASHGAVATGSPFVAEAPALQLQNATVTTAGSGAHALAAFTGGTINAAGSAIRAEGPGSYGLFSGTTSATRQNRVSIAGGSLSSTQSTAVQVAGSQLNLSLSTGVQVAGGNGTLFQVTGAGGRTGTLNLVADAATLTGAALTDAGSASNMTLQNNARWNVTGSSNVTRLVNDPSMIVFSAPRGLASLQSSYKTLTAVNYVGAGGTMSLNTYLGADGSPSDRLVIDGGTATGLTGLHVASAGGPGAVTLGNGIQVVDTINGGSTAPGAFVLSNRVVEGPYEYQLSRSSIDVSNPQGWYLRSQRAIFPPPTVPPPTVGPPSPEVIPPLIAAPLYRPEVAAYLANQRQAGSMFVHSLNDRLGEPQAAGPQSPDPFGDARRSGWLRLVGRSGDTASRDGNFSADTNSTLLQGGGYISRWSVGGDQGRLYLGGMLGYGSARNDATAEGNVAQARGEADGWSVGAYGTWFENHENKLGWYADVWGNYGWFKNSVKGDGLPEVRYNSTALTLSGETGYAMRIQPGSDWILEPQAQLVYVNYTEHDITEANGTRIGGNDGSGWVSRLGLRAYRSWSSDSGKRMQPYLTLNWWHDGVGNALAFNQVTLKDLYPKNRYEVKVGANTQLGQGWTAWGSLGYQWGSQNYSDTAVRLGARYTW